LSVLLLCEVSPVFPFFKVSPLVVLSFPSTFRSFDVSSFPYVPLVARPFDSSLFGRVLKSVFFFPLSTLATTAFYFQVWSDCENFFTAIVSPFPTLPSDAFTLDSLRRVLPPSFCFSLGVWSLIQTVRNLQSIPVF